MHLRNKNQRMLATTIAVSSSPKGHKHDLSEFSGTDVIVKDLNQLRNRNILRINTTTVVA